MPLKNDQDAEGLILQFQFVFRQFQLESYTEHPAHTQHKPGVNMTLLTQI